MADAGLATELVNLDELDRLMRDQRIEALVCRSGINVIYLSGIAVPGTLGRHLDLAETPRETFVVWPASGEPVVVISDIAAAVARATSRIAELETYRDYVDRPEDVLAGVLNRLHLASARVGFDQAWFGTRRWANLQRLLPGLSPVDCTDQLDLVRAVKTPAEVERLQQAAMVLDRAMMEVFPTVRAGQTERQVHAGITRASIELGAGSIHGILQTSSNPILYGGESEARLAAGDLVRTDYVAYVDGYAANLSRPLHIGPPSRAVEAKYASYLAIYREAVGLLRPSITGGDVYQSIRSLFASNGWEAGPPIAGHGIGVWFHQQRPLLVNGSPDVLQPGMVVAIEPISGHWHLQDEYLITAGDPLRISSTFDLERLAWTA